MILWEMGGCGFFFRFLIFASARDLSAKSMVLVKNSGILPLSSSKKLKIAVIGVDSLVAGGGLR